MTKFRDVKEGETFDFINPKGGTTFFRRCIKTSSRKYKTFDHGEQLSMTVGSINVEVFNVRPPFSVGDLVIDIASTFPAVYRIIPGTERHGCVYCRYIGRPLGGGRLDTVGVNHEMYRTVMHLRPYN